jgi:hypothetical protein
MTHGKHATMPKKPSKPEPHSSPTARRPPSSSAGATPTRSRPWRRPAPNDAFRGIRKRKTRFEALWPTRTSRTGVVLFSKQPAPQASLLAIAQAHRMLSHCISTSLHFYITAFLHHRISTSLHFNITRPPRPRLALSAIISATTSLACTSSTTSAPRVARSREASWPRTSMTWGRLSG